MTKVTPKPTTGVKKIKGLSVIEDRAYARATYTATYLFTLDYVKRTKTTYHDRWPTNDQVREWKARAARAWKYSTMTQREVWDMKAREHDNQQPLIAERVIQSFQTNASKSYGAVSLDIGEWCSASTIQVWVASFKSYSIYVERVLPLLLIHTRRGTSTPLARPTVILGGGSTGILSSPMIRYGRLPRKYGMTWGCTS
jgi:hypothetical protein